MGGTREKESTHRYEGLNMEVQSEKGAPREAGDIVRDGERWRYSQKLEGMERGGRHSQKCGGGGREMGGPVRIGRGAMVRDTEVW